LTLLLDVYQYCIERGVHVALIGAAAMSIHGVARATSDNDFMTTDRTVLAQPFWEDLGNAAVDVRKGDFDDPIAGVVRIKRKGDTPLDVVVGRYKVQTAIVARGDLHTVGDGEVTVVNAVDLILLKLFAGGPADMWDIHKLLESDSSLAAQVEPHISSLPEDAQQLWQKVLRDLPPSSRDLQ
jgi:hypothetical protein